MQLMEFLKSKRESLGAKILLVVTLFIMVMYVSFACFFVYYQGRAIREHLFYEGRQLAGMVAYSSRLGVFTENMELLKGPLEGVMQRDEVILVQVYASGGRLLHSQVRAGTKHFMHPADEDQGERMRAMGAAKDAAVISIEDNENIEFWAPVLSGARYVKEDFYFGEGSGTTGDKIGYVRIVLTKEILNKLMNNVVRKSIVIPFLFLIASWIISYFIVRGVVRPLKKLTTSVKTFETTGVFEKVTVQTHDEVGKLASAFNDMTDSLSKREAEKQQLEDRLRHAQKMEAIGTFAGGIAHDFNNILTVIKSYGQLLQKKDLPGEEERRFLDNILASAQKAVALTRSILAFGRKQTIDPHPLRLNQFILNMEEVICGFVGENIKMKVEPAEEELIVMADEGHLGNVLINMAANAKDAMPYGGSLTISVGTAVRNDESEISSKARPPVRYAVLSVTDTGIGMDRQTREKIFDPFFTTKEVGKGTGLGLSMAYGIIQQHKGFIDVESEPGRGAAFKIYLPLSSETIKEEDVKDLAPPKGGAETVLLAEDDDDVRGLITDVLARAGYKVIETGNGKEAFDKFLQNKDKVDVLLLDVTMPEKGGREVYEDARRIAAGIKVLFISGYSSGVSHGGAAREDEMDFLPKPVSPDELLRKLREILDK
jgi:signal transduction histidine kinase/CheY-like chemotaxis protein